MDNGDIEHLIDPHQFGNMKDCSVNHYLVNLLNVIYRGLGKLGRYANVCTMTSKKLIISLTIRQQCIS